jgi:hypothetical protein
MRLLLVSLAISFSGAATAQDMDANPATGMPPPAAMPELPVVAGIEAIGDGQTLARPAAKAGPGGESFQLLAGTGDRVVVTAEGPGQMMLITYTPEGAPMVAMTAPDRASLFFIAPIDGIYYVNVSRADGAKPYTLQLEVEEADGATAAKFHAMGYETHRPDGQPGHTACWMEPGKTYRQQAPGLNIQEQSLGGGQWVQKWVGDPNSPPRYYFARLEGNEIVITTAGGEIRHPAFAARRGAYRGYFCAEAQY